MRLDTKRLVRGAIIAVAIVASSGSLVTGRLLFATLGEVAFQLTAGFSEVEEVRRKITGVVAAHRIMSVITCPHCGHAAIERMPSNVCRIFYDCRGCGVRLKPKPGDCCVFCSYEYRRRSQSSLDQAPKYRMHAELEIWHRRRGIGPEIQAQRNHSLDFLVD